MNLLEAALTKSFKNVGGIPCEVPNFVGRKGQRSLIMEKLSPKDTCRIVSITGPPGFGKSAVAIQVGRELVNDGCVLYYPQEYEVIKWHGKLPPGSSSNFSRCRPNPASKALSSHTIKSHHHHFGQRGRHVTS